MTTTPERAARRAEVAILRAEKLSVRQIAEQLGASPAAIQRDIDALKRDTETAPDQDTSAPVSPRIVDVALPALPQTETPRHPTETTNRDTETPNRDTETPIVSSVTLPLDAALLDDLATLTRNGRSPEDAVRRALHFVANAYRQGWAAGVCPPTVEPIIDRFTIKPYPQP